MRKSLYALTFALSVLSTNHLYAQVGGSSTDISGTVGRPASIDLGYGDAGDFFRVIGDRFHTLEIDTKVYQMEKDGVTEKSYVAVFTAKGALLYNHELLGEDIDKIVGKNAGAQILPYTVSVAQDGRTFLSVAGFVMKNMNSAYDQLTSLESDCEYRRCEKNYEAGFWSVMDNLEVFVYEWDRGMQMDGFNTHKLKIVSFDMKLDILGLSKPGTFLAITGGAEFGVHKTKMQLGDDEILLKGTGGGHMPLYASLRYGLEFNHNTKNGWRYNTKVGFHHTFNGGAAFNPESAKNYQTAAAQYKIDLSEYQTNFEAYKTEKLQYESQNNHGNAMTDDMYKALTGKEKPVAPYNPKSPDVERLKRAMFFITPSLDISKNINMKGDRPVRMGLGVYGNIPLKDNTKGFRQVDLTKSNRETIGMKLFINF